MILLIRGLLFVVAVIAVATCSVTVKVGDRTTAEHIRRIWASDEAQELVKGVERKAAPVVERVRRGVGAGVREAAESQAARELKEEAAAAVDAGPPPDAVVAAPVKPARPARRRSRKRRPPATTAGQPEVDPAPAKPARRR